MSFTGSFNFGGSSTANRFSTTRGRMNGAMGTGVTYPSPFFDIAHTYLPTTVKSLFRYCRYYFMTNPLVNATVFKLSEYPITDIVVDHEDDSVRKRWTEYLHDHLRYRSFQVEEGLDYFTFGNGLASISYPFHKYLTCRTCQWSDRADRTHQHWRFTSNDYRLTCPKCGTTGNAIVADRYIRDPNNIRLVRWNVEDVDISYNELTANSKYYYKLPHTIVNEITMGKKDVVDRLPHIFIEAHKAQKGVIFNSEFLYHMRRPTLAGRDRGYGMPIILPVLKDTFALQVMKKAMEAVLMEHIVPLRTLFPQAASGTSDPFSTISLVDWRDQVASEIARWRLDPNYIPIMPVPIGQQSIGGDGRALLMFQEMQQQAEHIIMGMGVPREFLMGGLSYSGTNVSLRMLENAFITYIGHHLTQLRWVVKGVASFLEWPEVNVRFKPFKMADDLQRKALYVQMNQMGKISDTTLLADSDFDQSEENAIMATEVEKRIEGQKRQRLAQAEIEGEAGLIQMRYQAKGQQLMQQMMQPQEEQQGQEEPGGMPQEAGSPLNQGQQLDPSGGTGMGGADMMSTAQQLAEQIMQLPQDHQQQALQAIAAQSPELAQMVEQMLQQMQGGEQASDVDARPLPEQRPPTRDQSSV